MTLADITLVAFTACNSLRVLAYLPQNLEGFNRSGRSQSDIFLDLEPVPSLPPYDGRLRDREQG